MIDDGFVTLEQIIPRQAAQFMHALMNLSSDGIVVVDLDGKIIEVNEKFGKLHGWCRADMLRKKLPLEPFVMEEANDSHFHTDVIFSPLYDEHGKIAAFVGFEKERTSQK